MNHYLVHISETHVACAYCGKTEGECRRSIWDMLRSWLIGRPLADYVGHGDDLPEPW